VTDSPNLDLVRSIFAEWERGDFGSAEWADPEIEYEMVGGLSTGLSRGVAGMAERWGDWLSAWETLRVETEHYRQLDDERVLVLMLVMGRGKTSGAELSQTLAKSAVLFHMRKGKVTRLVQY
jgi:ketosteroid isomerase-like protein